MRAFAAGLVAGSLGVLRLAVEPPVVFAAIGPLVAVLAAVLGGCALARACPVPTRLAIGVLGGALATLLACQSAASRVLDARAVGVDVVVTGRVLDVPRRDDRRLAFELAVESAALPGAGPDAEPGAMPGAMPARRSRSPRAASGSRTTAGRTSARANAGG